MSADDATFDLRSDLHGHVIAYASGRDRSWFAEHPGQNRYVRAAFAHELCDPGHAAEGRCVAMYDAPAGFMIVIEVEQHAVGVRTHAARMVKLSAA